MIVNKYQTDLNDDLLDKLDPYVKDELLDSLERIEFLKKLVNPNRPYAKDLERWDRPYSKKRKRDPNGKIAVSFENPHILEDMDFFRPAALHFEKHGVYTHHFPSKHPNSEFKKFWREEKRRCKEGLFRESDGEWISGYNYYYWNYSPILIAEAKEQDELIKDELQDLAQEFEAVSADRVEKFPLPWDMDYFYFHYLEQAEREGKYGTVLKTRGRGYSYKGGAVLARNFNTFPDSKSWAFASDKGDLTDDGLLSKTWDNLNFINQHTAFKKRRQQKDTDMHKRASYIDVQKNVYKGYKSEIIGLTTANKPEKARGKRGKAILIEEAGRYLDLLKVWGIARPSMEQGSLVFGTMVAFGTGGTVGAAFEGLEELFYKGDAYRVKMIKNVFDKVNGQGKCAFYCPEYTNREGCYDKNGNSDVIKALIEIFYSRLDVIRTNANPHTIVQEKADRSITPQEAVMRTEGTLFPISDLKDYLSDISPNVESFTSSHYVGRLSLKEGMVKWKVDDSLYPLRDFPATSSKNKEGAIEIFAIPQENSKGEVYSNRYIGGIDPYDDDTGTSLGSVFIFDLWTDKIVAEYTGRPRYADDFYEICRRLGMYYNTTLSLNYENKNKGLFSYFNRKNSLYLLSDNPTFLKGTDDSTKKPAYGNKVKGTAPTAFINQLARKYQAQWMLTPDEDGVLNLQKIRSVGYIKEAISWNPDGNFDRVSAMGMVMIQREEHLKRLEEGYDYEETEDGLEKDSFWMKN